jgi:hypothetical protein
MTMLPRRRVRARLTAALLLSVTPACQRDQQPPPRTTATRPVAVRDAGFTNAGRIAAMLSVHAWASWPDGHFPPGIETIALEDAVAFLRDDPDRIAPSRHRRAIGKLAGYALEHANIRAALVVLGANPEAIEGALHADGEHLTPIARETFVNDMFADSSPFCPWKQLKVTPPIPGAPQITTQVTIWVPRMLADAAAAFDPQRWDECSKFFAPPERTYLAHLDAKHQPVADPVLPAGSTYVAASADGTTGLYESFTCNATGCSATFENMLNVTTWYSTPAVGATDLRCPDLKGAGTLRYNLTYTLGQALSGEVLGVQDIFVGPDQGEGCAQTDPAGGTQAFVSKIIEISNPVANGINQAILTFAEVAGEFADLLCCAPTAPGPSTTLPTPPGAPHLVDVQPVS